MRLTTILLIVIIIFVSGLFAGLMYDSVGKSSDNVEQAETTTKEKEPIEEQIEAELQALNDFSQDGEYELSQLEQVADHPVEKLAGTFEKGTTYFFEKVVALLYSLSELAF